MEEAILVKTNQVIETLDKDKNIIRLKQLTKEINSDEQLVALINDFNIKKELYQKGKINNDQFLILKKKLFSSPLFNEYNTLYLELNYLLIYFDNKLSSLLDVKSCKNPTCSRI